MGKNINEVKGKAHPVSKLLILAIIAIFAFAFFKSIKHKQPKHRQKASGEVKVEAIFNQAKISTGESFSVILVLNKQANRQIFVSGAQSVLESNDNLEIESAECLPPFDGTPFVKIIDDKLTVMCAIAISGQPILLTDQEIAFAKINLKATDKSKSRGKLKFKSVKVTEGGVQGKANDLSKAGSDISFSIE